MGAIPRKNVVLAGGVAAALTVVLAVTSGFAALASSTHVDSAHAVVPVLGSKKFELPSGSGFGKAHPKKIFNGGDPSGLAFHLVWNDWGRAVSTATGKSYAPKKSGGLYPAGRIELRASDLGSCTANGPLAYRHLRGREAPPHKSFGHWFKWSGTKTICRR
jgi:hypothetical protein